MSTVSHPSQQVQVVPDNNNNNKTSEGGAVNYDDLVGSSDIFMESLKALLGLSGKTLKVPTVGGNTLDLHRLFVEVTSRGGIAKVIKNREWREVVNAFNFPTTITSASFVLRRYYFKFLYEMEHVYYLQKPASLMQSAEEAMKSLSPNLEEGTDEPQIGVVVDGVIDAKFDSGYLVTMKMGSQVLKGVVYHGVQRLSQPQQTMGTTPSAMVPPSQRRARKKAKVAVVDSQKPKCHRSGYNFFFAEQYARLKPEYLGKERTITKMIGRMWSNLSEPQKQVYQDKGVKDVERYRSEMLEYKSAHEPGASASASASAAATVAQ